MDNPDLPNIRSSFCNNQLKPLIQNRKAVTRDFDGNKIAAMGCQSCGYVSFPAPREDRLAAYYSNEYARNSTSWYSLEADYAPGKVRSRADNAEGLLARFLPNIQDPVVLEIGCAFGGTVQELRRRGLTAFGTDLNSDAISKGRAFGNPYIHDDYAHSLFAREGIKANVVFAYHALEHIADLVAFFEGLKPCLADAAVLEFRVPNGVYLKALTRGFESWEWFAYPDHLHMLTPRSVLCLAERIGFRVVEITSSCCGETADEMAAWLGLAAGEPLVPYMPAMLEQALAAKELRFVFCRAGSHAAEQLAVQIDAAEARCKSGLAEQMSLILGD